MHATPGLYVRMKVHTPPKFAQPCYIDWQSDRQYHFPLPASIDYCAWIHNIIWNYLEFGSQTCIISSILVFVFLASCNFKFDKISILRFLSFLQVWSCMLLKVKREVFCSHLYLFIYLFIYSFIYLSIYLHFYIMG